MSNYAICVSTPHPEFSADVIDYLVDDGWTLVRSRGAFSFARMFSDVSYAGIQDQISGEIQNIADRFGIKLKMTAVDDWGKILWPRGET